MQARTAGNVEFRADLVSQLRVMARQGRSLEDLVRFVQGELAYTTDFIVPLLGYFKHAFGLRLYDVLPLREWVQDHDDRRVERLLEAIRETVSEDLANSEAKQEQVAQEGPGPKARV